MLRLLGEGGMGAVYEAEHTTTGRRLAVKLITLSDPRKKGEVVTRFEREARMAGSLDTEHIVQVIDSGEDTQLGMPFMVMELLGGEDLESLTERDGPLSPDVALRIAAQACVGLRQAHRANIIHRDIKPANLFLAQRDEGKVVVKILDFGIAKAHIEDGSGGDSGKLTRTGTMVGSPYFMSPEQALGEKDIDFRSDIWSLGVVLYKMLTGRTPHEDVESLGQIIMRICSKPAAPVQDLAPWVPAEVAAVVHKALMLERQKRYASTSEMLDALRALLPRGTDLTRDMLGPLPPEIRARKAARLTPAETGVSAALAQSSPSSSGARRSGSDTMSSSVSGGDTRASGARPRKPILAAVAVAVVAAVGFAGYGVTRPDAPPSGAGASPDRAATDPARSPSSGPVVEPAPGGAVAGARTVLLAISPGTAEVDVDGARVVAKDGKIELSGAPGSVHKVRVTAFTQFEERDVVIAESGPVPAKIEVVPRPAAATAPTSSVKPAATEATAPTPTAVKPTKPKPSSTVDKNFDQ